jgi:DNA-binding response OmpR family regulator
MSTNATQGVTILLVEDDPPVANALTDILAEAGYTVVHEDCGRPALARLLQKLPDLLLLDLGLPDIDGMEACRLARQFAPALPIVILTARIDTQDVVAGLDAGADDWIRKPFDSELLLARIAAVLRGRRAGCDSA